MTVLTILEFPDARLRKKAVPVKAVTAEKRQFIQDMFETMYAHKGIGLAATQVDLHERIIVIDASEEKNQPICLINPEIITQEGKEKSEEGCLSIPGFFEKIERTKKIKIKALSLQGDTFEMLAEGLLSVCVQHEIDHLEGKLFVDYLSVLKKQRIKKKLDKNRKKSA